ncbi:kinase [Russula earlei]|uniref:Kinase n=1 Tax=Russula earlei TaxID=71964 RepID=A0ACC0U249_9AGAM|nr:kinase [Russula earlei]
MNSLPPPKPAGPRTLQRSSSGVSSGPALPGEIPDRLAPSVDLSPPVPLTRATSATTGHRPSLTLNLIPGSTPYTSNPSRSPDGPAGRARAAAAATATAAPADLEARSGLVSSPVARSPTTSKVQDDQRTAQPALPITPRSISKIVSLTDLRQLVRRIDAQPPSPAASSSAAARNENGSSGDGDGPGAGAGARDSWSDGVLDVVAVLGEGASGAVEAVRDKRTGRRFARKTIITHEGPLKQLVRELAFLSGLRHTNVVRFYGAYMSPSNSEVKLMMELCEGKSLATVGEQIRRRKGRVGEKVARVLAEEVLEGLAYLHFKKVIHRDIKPSNILLSRQGAVKLCDFGVSGELIGSRAGTFTGTTKYMAPERIMGREYTICADVWSTGLSILELVQNRFPYPGDLAPVDLIMHVTTSEPPGLEDEPDLDAPWSDAMKDFIALSLTKDPGARPIPRDMLAHAWFSKASKKKVDMEQWINEVWNWDAPARDCS